MFIAEALIQDLKSFVAQHKRMPRESEVRVKSIGRKKEEAASNAGGDDMEGDDIGDPDDKPDGDINPTVGPGSASNAGVDDKEGDDLGDLDDKLDGDINPTIGIGIICERQLAQRLHRHMKMPGFSPATSWMRSFESTQLVIPR